jgi:hypothetical protein
MDTTGLPYKAKEGGYFIMFNVSVPQTAAERSVNVDKIFSGNKSRQL